MKARKKKISTWKEVKAVLSGRDKGELMALVGDLYSLSKENAAFVNVRCYALKGHYNLAQGNALGFRPL